MINAIRVIAEFLIETVVGAIIEAVTAPVTLALSIVKVGTVFAGSLM
jgi:hypothetical protein